MDSNWKGTRWRRLQQPLLILAAAGLTSYGLYRLAGPRSPLSKFITAVSSVSDAVSSAADTVSILSADLNFFLRSTSDRIPPSLSKLSKIATSAEASFSISSIAESVSAGVTRAVRSESAEGPSLTDRVVDRVLSDAGADFASAVSGSFARGLITGLYSEGEDAPSEADSLPRWGNLVFDDRFRKLIEDLVQVFVATAVSVYLDKTMDINTYDEFFAGLTNPKHEAKMKEVLVSTSNSAVETLVRTSHSVLMTPGISSDQEAEDVRWTDAVSSTVATNRKFVLDLVGRVTFETVRSFLDFAVLKMREGAGKGMEVVRVEILEKGSELIRYASAKSLLIFTLCLALCLLVFLRNRNFDTDLDN